MSEKVKSVEQALKYEEVKVPAITYSAEAAPSPEKHAEQLESIRQTVEQEAPKERPALPVDNTRDGNRPLYIDRELKAISLHRSFKQIRHQLPLTGQLLSRVVHQPVIKAASEVSAKTVTRPSGLLGGGLMAFVGSSTYLYLAKHVGFTYNYLFFLLFFVGGFALGLVIELLLFAVRPKQQG